MTNEIRVMLIFFALMVLLFMATNYHIDVSCKP